MLSEAALSVWAKTGAYEDGEPTLWLPLVTHLADTAGIADRLFRDWLSVGQWNVLTCCIDEELAPEERLEAVRAFVVAAAALHDIGKASPAFAYKSPPLAASMREHGLVADVDDVNDARTLPHGLAGHVLVESWLERRGWTRAQAEPLASIIGGHHGIPPSFSELRQARIHRYLGQGTWREVQREIQDWAATYVSLEDHENALRNAQWTQAALVIVQGIVITADWIASNAQYFPLVPKESLLPRRLLGDCLLQQKRVDAGWGKVKFSAPWEPVQIDGISDDFLRARFDVPGEAMLRPVQREAVRVAQTMPIPGMMIIEDVMGAGKTEAGLLAAEVLSARTDAAGVMMVLPTQAMADAMFHRFIPWMQKVLRAEGAQASVNLMHSKASMNDSFTQLDTDLVAVRNLEIPAHASDVAIDTSAKSRASSSAVVVRNPWLFRKKALLADFVVGTVDQLLMVALRTRHLALRHLGVSRKVVVIDEVHACDAFMGVYLERALEWLGAYGVSVVALSATLTPSLRARLLGAYARGAAKDGESAADSGSPVPARRLSRKAALAQTREESGRTELHYPAISYLSSSGIKTASVAKALDSKQVGIKFLQSHQLHRKVEELMKEDGCLLIIRNTVKKAQATYESLKESFGADVRVMHSRFINQHRLQNDVWLRENFGPPDRERTRPKRAIVVATQVAEQSLDIDFDALISDLAPIDLVFQRAGRVHRHDRADRPRLMRVPTCYVLDVPPSDESNVEACASIARNIYSPLLLLRTADLLRRRDELGLRISEDMAECTYQVYDGEDVVSSQWANVERNLKLQHDATMRASQFSATNFRLRSPLVRDGGLINWLDDAPNEIEANARARVREGADTLEVILLEESADEPGKWFLLSDFACSGDPMEVPRWSTPSPEMVRRLSRSLVSLPPNVTAHGDVEAVIRQLEENQHGWGEEPQLAGQLVLVLREGIGNIGGKTLRYSREKGLEEQ